MKSKSAIYVGNFDYFGPSFESLQTEADFTNAVSEILESAKSLLVLREGDEMRHYLYNRAIDSQINALSRKDPSFSCNEEVWIRTIDSFETNEDYCKLNNLRLAGLLNENNRTKNGGSQDALVELLDAAHSILNSILGECKPIESLRPSFSSGATTSIKDVVSIAYKLNEDIHRNFESRRYDRLWSKYYPDWWRSVDVFATPVYVSCVQKNADIHRIIASENTFSMFIERAIGIEIRNRLRTVGIDLQNAQGIHRLLAKIGSETGIWSTMDLKSASDLICLVLGYLLFNWNRNSHASAWWSTLIEPYITRDYRATSFVDLKNEEERQRDDVLGHYRPSHWGRKGFKVLKKDDRFINYEYFGKLEKLVTAGNGFCFELESLIFYSIAKAAQRIDDSKDNLRVAGPGSRIYVYGDDVICPPRNFDVIAAAFEACGLIVNRDKSYKDGPFRESCGADYYLGTNLRPWFKTKRWSAQQCVSLYNHLRVSLTSADHGLALGTGHFDGHISVEWENLLSKLMNLFYRNCTFGLVGFGPTGYGDGHFVHPDWETLNDELSKGFVFYKPSADRDSFYDTIAIRMMKARFESSYLLYEDKSFPTWVQLPLKDVEWGGVGTVKASLYKLSNEEPTFMDYVNPRAASDPYSVRGAGKPVLKVIRTGGNFHGTDLARDIYINIIKGKMHYRLKTKSNKFVVKTQRDLASRLLRFKARKAKG